MSPAPAREPLAFNGRPLREGERAHTPTYAFSYPLSDLCSCGMPTSDAIHDPVNFPPIMSTSEQADWYDQKALATLRAGDETAAREMARTAEAIRSGPVKPKWSVTLEVSQCPTVDFSWQRLYVHEERRHTLIVKYGAVLAFRIVGTECETGAAYADWQAAIQRLNESTE